MTPCENPQLKRNCHARDNTEDKNTFATQAFFPLHFSSQNHQDGKLQTCRTKLYIFVLTLFLVSFSFVCRRETLEKELEEIKQHWNYVVVSHYFNRVHTGPGKPEKSWNFIMAFSRTGKSLKKATGPGKFWKYVKLKAKI